jgi:hypothetical protein
MGDYRMINQINLVIIKIWSIAAISLFFILFLWGYFEYGFDWIIVSVSIACSLVFFMGFAGRHEFILRPKEVKIDDSGFTLFQNFGRKPIFIPWSGVVKINYGKIDPKDIDWWTVDRYLFVFNNKSYVLYWEIAREIRERYKNNVGTYPPDGAWTGELI